MHICKRARRARRDVGSLTLPVVDNNNGDHDGNNEEEETEETEAYPPLLASCPSGINRLDGVTQASFRILLDMSGSLLDDIDCFVLLFDQDTHLDVDVRRFMIAREINHVHR